jgi:hypothetical protein
MAQHIGNINVGEHMRVGVWSHGNYSVLIPQCQLHGSTHEPIAVRVVMPSALPIQPCPVCVRHAAIVQAVA